MSEAVYQLDEQKNRIVALQDEKEVGEITFSQKDEETITINETFVEPDHRGGNIAQELVEIMVDYAKENDKKVIPACPYAKKQFEKNPEYQEVEK